ncbi:torsin-1A-like [Mizuhopecten yessoensis]|uniref:torsin-1A-like n=1 Tax=Mizuhopecten yessoensis TaxID=6573 RepID=UPI000B45CAE8|nr:torsin-1A-like [Mizuhopecten yessoensis]
MVPAIVGFYVLRMAMKPFKIKGVLWWLSLVLLVPSSTCLEPVSIITAVGAGISATFMAAYRPVKCRYFAECCIDRHIMLNETALRRSLDLHVYGQHLCTSAVINHLRAHTRSASPSKALALSFHGSTGTGKNFVSKIIAESLYRKGMKSKYVHLISATKEFPHKEMVPLYKDKLKELIESNVAECERSLFIFDEVDKMPVGLLDIVKPYLDFYEDVGGVDFRKSIFIFLSNTAGKAILTETLNQWREGRLREQLALVDMESLITKAAVNTKNSGLWHSELLLSHMISAHLPFLPMERKHVRQCIKDSLITKKYYRNHGDIDDRIVREIADQLPYFPEDEKMFSVTGCKRVPEKVDYIMAGYDDSLQ